METHTDFSLSSAACVEILISIRVSLSVAKLFLWENQNKTEQQQQQKKALTSYSKTYLSGATFFSTFILHSIWNTVKEYSW